MKRDSKGLARRADRIAYAKRQRALKIAEAALFPKPRLTATDVFNASAWAAKMAKELAASADKDLVNAITGLDGLRYRGDTFKIVNGRYIVTPDT